MRPKLKLEQSLEAVIDSGIDLTISSLCDRGIDFTFLPFEKIADCTYNLSDWHYVPSYGELAGAIDSCMKELFPHSRYPLMLEGTRSRTLAKRDLCRTLQALLDSKIDVTVSWMRLTGVGYALISCLDYLDLKPQDWHHVPDFFDLAEALHRQAVGEFANSEYARKQTSIAPLTSAGSG